MLVVGGGTKHLPQGSLRLEQGETPARPPGAKLHKSFLLCLSAPKNDREKNFFTPGS